MRRDLKKERCFRSHCKNALKLDIYLINLQNKKWLWIKVVPFLTYEVPPAGRQTWVFPKIGVTQNAWFVMETPIKLDDLGVPPFRKHPHDELGIHHG